MNIEAPISNNIIVTGNGTSEPYQFVWTYPIAQLNQNTNPPPMVVQNGVVNLLTHGSNELIITLPTAFQNQILQVLVSGYVSIAVRGGLYNPALEVLVPAVWNNTQNQSNSQFTVSATIPEDLNMSCFNNFGFNVQYIAYGY